MKIHLPHLGEKEVCVDDSCDGAHCTVCGCHFWDFYGGGPTCETCMELTTQQAKNIRKVIRDTEDDLRDREMEQRHRPYLWGGEFQQM